MLLVFSVLLTFVSILSLNTGNNSSLGNGIFGNWIYDDNTLCYEYIFDQYTDERARWVNSVHEDRRTHWYNIGNSRVNVMCSNDGLIQLYISDRGGTIINKFGALDFELKPNQRNKGNYQKYAYSGGYSYIVDKKSNQIWSTAYRYFNKDVSAKDDSRLFCANYFNTTLFYNGIQMNQTVHAPSGNDPLILIDISLTNRKLTNVELDFYQYFDVNIYRLQLQWIRTGSIAASLGDEERFNLNQYYDSTIKLVNQTLVFHQYSNSHTPSSIENITNYDPLPFDIFLTDLSVDKNNSKFSSTYFYDKKRFFGQGGAAQPDYLYNKSHRYNLTDDDHMPYCLILNRKVSLAVGETIYLRFAFGVVVANESRDFVNKYKQNSTSIVEAKSVHFHIEPSEDLNITDEMSYLFEREMKWHSVALTQSIVYNQYFNVNLIPQGSTYLYLHGLDGAPRDLMLTSISMNYLQPKLSKDLLILIMSQQNSTTGRFPYSFAGNGLIADALGLHSKPSDLDIYFLWGLVEYISATGNENFLFEKVNYYCHHKLNQGSICHNGTVLEHAKLSYYHLIKYIGIGESGLLKIGDGDWDDGIIVSTCLSAFGIENLLSDRLTKEYGESIPNTQQALYVLPLLSSIVKSYDEQFSFDLIRYINTFKQALIKQFNGNHFNRAVFKNVFNKSIALTDLNLQAQVWPLITGFAYEIGVENQIIKIVQQHLDDPTPNGAALQPGGQVWPCISQLLTWSYTNCNYTKLAWRSLYKNTFAHHANIFPSVWFNIWSGPDGILSTDGTTWSSPVTPMTDFPVMNSNPHVMSLFALLKTVCLIQPSANGDGLLIDLTKSKSDFVLNFPLIQISFKHSYGLKGIYHAFNDGTLKLYIIKPNSQTIVVPLHFITKQQLSFEVLF